MSYLTPMKNWQKMVKENINLLRNRENYHLDVCQNDVSRTGIKEICVFNNINGYDFTVNQASDPMHDILEGVAKNVIRDIIYELTFRERPYINLATLNQRLESFDYTQRKFS